ncbi:MAG: hypothetical protein ACPGJS_19345 [Flammeovirgaceae bacterium]
MNHASTVTAIDIVLLPKQQLMQEVIALNQQIDQSGALPLNQENCIPHISMAMGAVKSEDLPVIYAQVEKLTAAINSLAIEVSGIYSMMLNDGRSSFGLDLAKQASLINLHTKLMEIISPFLVAATVDSIDPIRGLDQVTLDYIDGFVSTSSYQHFRPHITVGFGVLHELTNITLNSTIEGVFICQLANYCTCARILKSFPFIS